MRHRLRFGPVTLGTYFEKLIQIAHKHVKSHELKLEPEQSYFRTDIDKILDSNESTLEPRLVNIVVSDFLFQRKVWAKRLDNYSTGKLAKQRNAVGPRPQGSVKTRQEEDVSGCGSGKEWGWGWGRTGDGAMCTYALRNGGGRDPVC